LYIVDTNIGNNLTSTIYNFTTVSNLSLCPCGYEDIKNLDTIRDDSWIVGVMIIIAGLVFIVKRRK